MNTRYFHFDASGAITESQNAIDFFKRKNTIAAEATACAKGDQFVWIDCLDPERIELEDLAVNFDLHRLSVDDCFDESPIPKIDIFPDYIAIVFNDVIESPASVELSEINWFLGRDFLLTVRRAASEKRTPLNKTLERLRRSRITAGPAMLLHALMDEIVDRVFPAIEGITERITGMEDSVITGSGAQTGASAFDPAELSDLRRDMLSLRKSLNYERELVSRLRRRESPLIADSLLPYFADIHDHLSSYLDLAEAAREMIGNLVQMNLTLSSNSMAEASNRMNRSVSRLTFITTIFMPLTLLSGIGGMSEWTMITGADNWRLSYPLLIVAFIAIAAATSLILHRMDKRK